MSRNISKHLILSSQQLNKEKKYWEDKFSGELPACHFPYDSLHPTHLPDQHGKGIYPFRVPPDLYDQLVRLSNNSSHNMFMILLAAVLGILNKHTGEQDIIIAVPMFKQHIEGHFLNTIIAIRLQFTGTLTFKELVLQVKKSVMEANENVNYPLLELLHNLELPGGGNGLSLIETTVLMEDIHKPDYLKEITPNILLSFHRWEKALEGVLEYNTQLYNKETVEKITRRFMVFLQQAMEGPGNQIIDLTILSQDERHEILEKFNSTAADYPAGKTIAQLFRLQAAKTPHHIAVVIKNHRMSCEELNKKADQLARHLVKKGVKPGSIVGIMAEPSIERMIGMMAVLKTGSAYLPIDAEFPEGRIIYMLKDSRVELLLTRRHLIDKNAFNRSIIDLDDSSIFATADPGPIPNGTPADVIYVIYTSGTSGKPKGVLIQNESVVNYVTWFSTETGLTDKDKTTLSSSFAMDLGYTSIYTSLLNGCELHLLDRATYYDIENFLDYIPDNRINYIKLTPSFFSLMVNNPGFSRETFKYVRLVVLGGEAIILTDVEKLRSICPHVRVMNHYGPTEATIGCIAQLIDFNRFREYQRAPTIGKPICNTRVYIFDPNANLLPGGVPGELAVSGVGLARGYLNRPLLTAEKFVKIELKVKKKTNPREQSAAHMSYRSHKSYIYQTGDLARWLTNGNIQFLGRKDNQVKIRGFRIELGEIENQILKHPDVKEVVVLAVDDKKGEKFLCAYIVSTPGENPFDVGALKDFLADNLPDYMIPHYFAPMDKIPLTANGKVDRNVLQKIEISWDTDEYTPPENETQAKMIEIWSQVLEVGKNKIGIHTNFFELGGHSLKVMLLAAKIHKEFDTKISMAELFKCPTAAGLTKYITEKEAKERYRAIEPKEAKEYYPLSSPQRRFYLAHQLNRENMAYNMPVSLVLPPGINEKNLEPLFKELTRRHESLRTSFKMINNEPYQIIHKNVDIKIDIFHVQGERAAETMENFIRPFDLNTLPLFRLALIDTGQERILALDMHHIISDGVSLQLLTREFFALIKSKTLAPLSVQYKEYASWQNNLHRENSFKKMEQYWLDTLENFKITGLPGDKPGRDALVKGNYQNAVIEKNTYLKIKKFCTQYKITIFSFMLSVFLFILTKETGETDLTLGIPADNREHLDLENIIGLFLNVFLLRAKIHQEDTIINNILKINKTTADALANSAYPYEDLYYRLRDRYQLPNDELFTILFNYLPGREEEETRTSSPETVPLVPLEIPPKYPVTVYIKEISKKLELLLVYRRDLYSKNRIRRIIQNYSRFIEIIMTREDRMVSDLVYEDVEKDDSLKEFEEEFENEDLF